MQFKVHFKQLKNHNYMKPQFINDSMLNATQFVNEYCKRHKFDYKRSEKRNYKNNLMDITGNEVNFVNEKYKTNDYHVLKRKI
jgi:hypothetical protein